MKIPRLVIAGTHSGVGKTTVAIGLMAGLRHRGIVAQPFKVGPDYIDPSYHTAVSGRTCRNLDSWLLTHDQILGLFQSAAKGSPIAIIEGVMGLFDGSSSANEHGSTAEVAKWLRAPVILVVDATSLARSAAAMVLGYAQFDRKVNLAGIIFNRVASKGHYQALCQAMRRYTHIPVLGYFLQDDQLTLPERHLGLVPAQEGTTLTKVCEQLIEQGHAQIDLEQIMKLAKAAPGLPDVESPLARSQATRRLVRIGIAKDQAFHFYYQENLELLESFGAELVPFSPLDDQHLPRALDALYLGGGFPEVFAKGLEGNRSLREEVKRAVNAGLPTYAECGGLMYLAEQLEMNGTRHAMVGILPGRIRMTDRLKHFGYVKVIPKQKTILSGARDPIKGHEFHYSVWVYHVPSVQQAYLIEQRGHKPRMEGLARRNLLASYIHVHFLTNRRWARGFIQSAVQAKEKR